MAKDRGFDKGGINGDEHHRRQQVQHEARRAFDDHDATDEEEHDMDLDAREPDLVMGHVEFHPGAKPGTFHVHKHTTEQHHDQTREEAHAHLDQHLTRIGALDQGGSDEGGRTGTAQSTQHGTTSGASGPGWSGTPGEF